MRWTNRVCYSAVAAVALFGGTSVAHARFLQVDPVGYKDPANLYAYVNNDPTNQKDPSGLDAIVQLNYYAIPGAAGFEHQYIIIRDTDTGATVVSRGGPYPAYNGGSSGGSSDQPSNAPNTNTTSKLVTTYGPVRTSYDAKQPSSVVEGSRVVIKGKFSDVTSKIVSFNKAVDDAKIDYTPRSDNSNAYAGTAYKVITGKDAPTSFWRPGSGNDLTPKIPTCQSDPKTCGGK